MIKPRFRININYIGPNYTSTLWAAGVAPDRWSDYIYLCTASAYIMFRMFENEYTANPRVEQFVRFEMKMYIVGL